MLHRHLMTLAWLLLVVSCSSPSAPDSAARARVEPTAEILGEAHSVLREGQRISLWEKRAAGTARRPVMVLVHGATWSGRPDFDLQIRGYSAMDAFAAAGWDVFAIDILGYGDSDEPVGESWSRTADAVKDLRAAIEWITAERGVEDVALLGWSWGAQIAGVYSNQYPESVERLLLMGFTWGRGFPKRDAPTTRYRTNTAESAASDFIEGCYEQDVVDEYVRVSLAADPVSPNGVLVDFSLHLPLVDPTALPMPVMLLYGEHEVDSARLDDATAFLNLVGSTGKSLVILEGGGHAVLLEKPHRRWQQTVLAHFAR